LEVGKEKISYTSHSNTSYLKYQFYHVVKYQCLFGCQCYCS